MSLISFSQLIEEVLQHIILYQLKSVYSGLLITTKKEKSAQPVFLLIMPISF